MKKRLSHIVLILICILALCSCVKSNDTDKGAESGNSVSKTVNKAEKEVTKEEQKNVSLVESGYSIKDDGYGNVYVYYGATVNNPNKKNVASFPSIIITAKDQAGTIVGTNEQMLYSIAPEDTVSFGGLVSCNGAVPATVEITANCSKFDYQEAGSVINTSTMQISNTSEIADDFGTNYTGEIENTGEQNISSAAVTVILKNNGAVVYGDTTYVNDLTAGSKKAFQLSTYDVPEHTEFILSAQAWQ